MIEKTPIPMGNVSCGPYDVGANFSGFKDFCHTWSTSRSPVTEIDAGSGCVITRTTESGGRVTPETVKAQLQYEPQGHIYLNPDALADLAHVRVEQWEGDEERVRVLGVKSLRPPRQKSWLPQRAGTRSRQTFLSTGSILQRRRP
ncbi:acyclic terpene utilization AtuA family protein [Microdochium nivale]|nr:acyclic terpene utilization AtuA family protein [Microdochium nivale]